VGDKMLLTMFTSVLLKVNLYTGINALPPKPKKISIKYAKELLKTEEYTLIDVRSPSEYNEDHIIEAHLIPCDELETRIKELNPNNKYIVICRSGNRSNKACDILTRHGFKYVYNIDGGMNKWYE
jgi:rhodanese-related sulfurtransferase